jgi:signal transduction histidine kinase
MGQIENKARIIFRQIIITRQWIADHGGIFVEKMPWTKPSPYLENPEIKDVSGKRYVMQTPAMVTKELSQYSKDKELYWFHITSLKLTNPDNAPDAFEKGALQKFDKGEAVEIISTDTIDNQEFLRYIAPLYVKESCLKCHSRQGYRIGDVRGAISISIPMANTLAEISGNRRDMIIAGVLTVAVLIIFMLTMIKRLILSPMNTLKDSINKFSEGQYSPGNPIKTGDEFEDLNHTFSEMARTLTGYHDDLNDKIRDATRELLETNMKLQGANSLLNEANTRKSDFVVGVSHELRTPLTSIKGAMDYLSVKLSPENAANIDRNTVEDISIFFEVIKKNAERLIRMVTTILDLERLETGTHEWHFMDSNLSYLIAETLTALKVNAGENGIYFTVAVPEYLPVRVDEDRIRQVLTNLISNAMKFSPLGSEITIVARMESEYVITEILDRGPVIGPGDTERIFDKFYKSGNKEGTGLGLAICRSIIDGHNGVIGVVTRKDATGNCFYFKLNASAPSSGASQSPSDGHASHQQRLIEITQRMANS